MNHADIDQEQKTQNTEIPYETKQNKTVFLQLGLLALVFLMIPVGIMVSNTATQLDSQASRLNLKPQAGESCVPAGCSGQMCVPESQSGIATTCEFRPEFACLQNHATCELQARTGECGWTKHEGYDVCMASASEGDMEVDIGSIGTPSLNLAVSPVGSGNEQVFRVSASFNRGDTNVSVIGVEFKVNFSSEVFEFTQGTSSDFSDVTISGSGEVRALVRPSDDPVVLNTSNSSAEIISFDIKPRTIPDPGAIEQHQIQIDTSSISAVGLNSEGESARISVNSRALNRAQTITISGPELVPPPTPEAEDSSSDDDGGDLGGMIPDGEDYDVTETEPVEEIVYPLGDINQDQLVNIQDYLILMQYYGTNLSQAGNLSPASLELASRADLNGDGMVDLLDYGIFYQAYQAHN